jgi:hypothetical protein
MIAIPTPKFDAGENVVVAAAVALVNVPRLVIDRAIAAPFQ